MKVYDIESQRVLEEISSKENNSNMTHYGIYTLKINRYYKEQLIREVIWIYNTITIDYSYRIDKYKDFYELINIEIRNIFSKKLPVAVLKCAYGFNIYSTRDSIINKLKVDILYSRYSKIKS